MVATDNPRDAERLLLDDQTWSTDVLCGQDFGIGSPQVSTFIARWRHRYPRLGLVVITSAADGRIEDSDTADAVCRVPIEPGVLFRMLLGPEPYPKSASTIR